MSLIERFNELISSPIFRAGNESISLLWLLKLLSSLLIVFILINLFKRLIRDYLLTRLNLSQGNREAISTLVSYSTGTIAFLVVLSVNGLDLASLAVVLGGLGVGIGFGLQELTKNLVSGLTLLIEGKLQVGDYIEFNGLAGYIKEIDMRCTLIRTFDGGDVVVPNSTLVGNQVLNWSYKNYTGKIRLPIGVAYASDPILVTETLLNSAYMEPTVLYEPPPRVIFKGFGDNALNFELWAWISRIDEGISVKSSLNYIIEYNLRQAGIRIPFPQRELWLNNPEVLSAALIEGGGNGGAIAPASSLPMAEPVSIRHLLKQVPYFEQTSDLYLRGVIEAGYRKLLTDGEILFQEGDIAAAVYIVLSGKIEALSVRLAQTFRTYVAGEFFGEAPVMLNVPYLVTARALGDVCLFVIPKANFEKLLHACSRLAETFAEEVSKEEMEYSGLRQQLQDLGLLSMTNRDRDFVSWVQTRLRNLFNVAHE